MSFHLHVFNLREDATNQDLRQLFSGMSIQQDGVTIVGGPKGEAFITFDSELDLLRAMKMDGEQHLRFKVASDVDKLRGINQMCLANLQKLKESDSLFMPDEHSTERKRHDIDVHASSHQETYGDPPARHFHSSDPSEGDNYDAKRRKPNTDSNYDANRRKTNTDSNYDANRRKTNTDSHYRGFTKNDPDVSRESYQTSNQPETSQPPWVSTRQQIGPEHSFSPNLTSPDYPPNQFKESASFPHNSIPLQFPYPPPNVPGRNYPMPGFQAEAKRNPVPVVLPQPKPHSPPGSLLMSLLPKSGHQRYCIKVSDLPPNVTASMVWSWVGGSQGTALGVILLKSAHESPAAFLIYDNMMERDQRLRMSNIIVAKFTNIATCRYISGFVNSWTKWKGAQKMHSPIFETTISGNDQYVFHRTFYDFVNNFHSQKITVTPSQPPKYPLSSDTKVFTETTKTKEIEEVQKPRIAIETPLKQPTKRFLVLYQLEPTITATEVLSWFSDGISAYKLKFLEGTGPKDSEAIAFILFDSLVALETALSGLSGKDLITGMRSFGGGYIMMNKYGDKCKITRTTSDGDRIVSPEDRKQIPFSVEGKIPSKPSIHAFNLCDSIYMKFLHLKGISHQTTANDVWHWFPYAKGVITMMKHRTNDLEAVIAFKDFNDLSRAAHGNTIHKVDGKPRWRPGMEKWKSQKRLKRQEAFAILSRFGYKIRITTKSKSPDRKITAQEVKFILSKRLLKKPVKAETCSTKSQATPEEKTSFLYHLKAQVDPMEEEVLCLVMENMRKSFTACQLFGLFRDAVCALKVNFVGDAFGLYGSEANGYLLLKNIEERDAARILLENCTEKWMSSYVRTDVGKNSELFHFMKMTKVEAILSRICHKAVISESSPSGVDRVLTMEELAVVPINPPFTLVHDPPCLHYIQVSGAEKHITAGEIWACFGWRTGQVKGVVLLIRKTDPKGYIACVAFDNLKGCNDHVDSNVKWFRNRWPSFLKMTERQVLGFLMGSAEDYVIKVSTEMGPDRDLTPAEEQLLAFPTKIDPVVKESFNMSTENPSDDMSNRKVSDQSTKEWRDDTLIKEHRNDMLAKKQGDDKPTEGQDEVKPTKVQRDDKITGKSDEQPTERKCDEKSTIELNIDKRTGEQSGSKAIKGQTNDRLTEEQSDDHQTEELYKSVGGENLPPSQDIKCGFYIRLKKVPSEVTTASEVLSLFTSEGGQGKIATLVRDCNGVGISAYVMFAEVGHRDSALLKHPSSVRCTDYGRAVRLAEFEPEYEILESTESGEDRVLSAEERAGFEEQFSE